MFVCAWGFDQSAPSNSEVWVLELTAQTQGESGHTSQNKLPRGERWSEGFLGNCMMGNRDGTVWAQKRQGCWALRRNSMNYGYDTWAVKLCSTWHLLYAGVIVKKEVSRAPTLLRDFVEKKGTVSTASRWLNLLVLCLLPWSLTGEGKFSEASVCSWNTQALGHLWAAKPRVLC